MNINWPAFWQIYIPFAVAWTAIYWLSYFFLWEPQKRSIKEFEKKMRDIVNRMNHL